MSDIRSGHPLPLWSSFVLHKATLFTVIEGWRRCPHRDATIDGLVAEPFTTRLQNLRDGVFHFGAVYSPAITAVMEDKEMIEWSARLHRAFRTFFARDFPEEETVGRVVFSVT